MSYEIETDRRVYHLDLTKSDDLAFPHAAVYLCRQASNNVHPPDWNWSVQAIEWDTHPPPHCWAGNIMLPLRIYENAHYAAGGGIKPGSRDVSGIEYLQLWEKEARKPVAKKLSDWKPRVSIWGPKSFVEMVSALEASAAYEKDKLIAALTWLPLKRGYYDTNHECECVDERQLVAALTLWRARERLPFKFYLSGE